MAQTFPPIANVISKASILGSVGILALALWIWAALLRSPYVTRAGVVLDQPVPFSHRHHVNELGIECRYCHAFAEVSPYAGMPTLTTCMTCHSQIHVDSPMLAPVRDGFRDEVPIAWQRVNDLPDFVYFDHSIHVQKGVGCETCHGPVHLMPLTWRHSTLHMEWCLECHREPEQFIRARELVFEQGWDERRREYDNGRQLVERYAIESAGGRLTDCTICHR